MIGNSESLFPADSVLRKVHGERVVGVLYGQVALLMQAADPVAFTGLAGASEAHDAPFDRLARTAKIMETVYFGSRADAEKVTKRVRHMHSFVKGTIGEDAGPHPVGTPFSAEDPKLLLWILACLADSALSVYKTFVGRLSDAEFEQFWQEYLIVGELFGLPREHAPVDYQGFRDYMKQRLQSGELFVTPLAKRLGLRIALLVPAPAPALLVLPAVDMAVLAVLPEQIRRLYGIPWPSMLNRALPLVALSARLAGLFTPDFISQGQSSGLYGIVARTEARRRKLTKLPLAVARRAN